MVYVLDNVEWPEKGKHYRVFIAFLYFDTTAGDFALFSFHKLAYSRLLSEEDDVYFNLK